MRTLLHWVVHVSRGAPLETDEVRWSVSALASQPFSLDRTIQAVNGNPFQIPEQPHRDSGRTVALRSGEDPA